MLEEIGTGFELHEIDLAHKPAEFLALSPTGKVPLLLDGELKLYESFVVIQYVAERYGLPNAFAAEPGLRARQRLAMLQFDSVVVPAFYQSLAEGAGPGAGDALERELDELAATAAQTELPSLLAFHLAPFWLRMRWMGARAPMLQRFERRAELCRWLDGAAALPSVQHTAPDRDETVARMLARFGPAQARPGA